MSLRVDNRALIASTQESIWSDKRINNFLNDIIADD